MPVGPPGDLLEPRGVDVDVDVDDEEWGGTRYAAARRSFSWSCKVATWPRRRTVSSGRRMKSSAVEERKVLRE